MVNDANKELPHIDPSNHTLDSIVISCQDVKDVLLHLNVTKASGPDLISPRLLREGADILALPYSFIFNRSLDQGYFPSSWKEANVTPIYNQSTESTDGDGCIYAFKSSNREIFSLIPFVQPVI